MESKKLKWSVCLLFILSLGFTSCDDDKIEPEKKPETVEIKNAELKAVLEFKRFAFNEQGELIQDESVLNLTTLDLSGSELTDVSGLEVFPKLTEVNLSDNNFDVEFDFSVLPATIKGVDLTKNEIFYYNGLVDVEIEENGDKTVTTLRALTKLYLPEDAKFDIESLAPFYSENKATVDMKMENEAGVLEAYTTLRDIPNAGLKEWMLETYPSIFTADKTKVDISRPISGGEETQSFAPPGVTDLTGMEYIIRNTAWEGISIDLFNQFGFEGTPKISYMKMPSKLVACILANVETPYGIDFSVADQLKTLYLIGILGLKKVDLSMNPVFGVEDLGKPVVVQLGTGLMLVDCESLEEVLFPEKENLATHTLLLELLPKLRKCDLSNFVQIDYFVLGLLGQYDLVYPDLKYFGVTSSSSSSSSSSNHMGFACTSDILSKESTKEFLYKNHWSLPVDERFRISVISYFFLTEEGNAAEISWILEDPSN